MMKAFLFWTLHKQDLTASIASFAQCYQIDIFMFAECGIPIRQLLTALNTTDEAVYFLAPTACEKIVLLIRFSPDLIQPVVESDRLTIQHLQLPGSPNILLAVTYLVDPRNWDEDSQNAECTVLVEQIEEAERVVEHSRTVLVGDLNMNPFQPGVVNARGLHAVMTKNIASEEIRVVQGRLYKYFYNPMWSLWGDGSPGPPRTFYHRKAVHKVYFWNIFDQILIRPALLPIFGHEDVSILDHDGTRSLATVDGYPDKMQYSDHFPIKFQLNL